MRSMERGVTTRAAAAARVLLLPLSPAVAQARQCGFKKTKSEGLCHRSGCNRRGSGTKPKTSEGETT